MKDPRRRSSLAEAAPALAKQPAPKAGNRYELYVGLEGSVGENARAAAKFYAHDRQIQTLPEPRIPIASFRSEDAMEETLIRWIHRICQQHRRFFVTLNNFGGLPPDAIYLRVLDHDPFRRLAAGLQVIDPFIQSCGFPAVDWPQRPFCALLTGLRDTDYRQVLAQVARQDFQGTFRVHHIVMKKEIYGRSRPVLVNLFPLMP